ncbi:MAG: preprotein translocase subunit SecE [Lysobacteraceae bacterium]
MNTKIVKSAKPESGAPGTSGADIVKYVFAGLLLAAGIFGYYWFGAWVAGLRALLAAAGFVAALFVMAQTAAGRSGLEYLSEARFELRKVVWPKREESIRTTGVIIAVIVIMSLILALIDKVFEFVMLKLLG